MFSDFATEIVDHEVFFFWLVWATISMENLFLFFFLCPVFLWLRVEIISTRSDGVEASNNNKQKQQPPHSPNSLVRPTRKMIHHSSSLRAIWKKKKKETRSNHTLFRRFRDDTQINARKDPSQKAKEKRNEAIILYVKMVRQPPVPFQLPIEISFHEKATETGHFGLVSQR